MRHLLVALLGLTVSFGSLADQSSESILRAAGLLRGDVVWDPASIVKADIDCDGRQDAVILGKTVSDAILLVFNRGLSRKPIEFLYSFAPYGERSMKLYVENLSMSDQDIDAFLAPGHGYRRSTTCKGLYLYDGERDGLHMYWVKHQHQLVSWSH